MTVSESGRVPNRFAAPESFPPAGSATTRPVQPTVALSLSPPAQQPAPVGPDGQRTAGRFQAATTRTPAGIGLVRGPMVSGLQVLGDPPTVGILRADEGGRLVYFDDKPVPVDPPKREGWERFVKEIERISGKSIERSGGKRTTEVDGARVTVYGGKPSRTTESGTVVPPEYGNAEMTIYCDSEPILMAALFKDVSATRCPGLPISPEWTDPAGNPVENKTLSLTRTFVPMTSMADGRSHSASLTFPLGQEHASQWQSKEIRIVTIDITVLIWWCCNGHLHGPFGWRTKISHEYDCPDGLYLGSVVGTHGPWNFGGGELAIQEPEFADNAAEMWADTSWGSIENWCKSGGK